MADEYKYLPRQPEQEPSVLQKLAAQTYRDPIREYLGEQSVSAYGDAGANATSALLTGAGAGSANPIVGALLALGFGGRAVQDVYRAREMSGAADAFGRTGLPGAPLGPQLPLPHEDPRVGRFATMPAGPTR